jgi:hypothetical protein
MGGHRPFRQTPDGSVQTPGTLGPIDRSRIGCDGGEDTGCHVSLIVAWFRPDWEPWGSPHPHARPHKQKLQKPAFSSPILDEVVATDLIGLTGPGSLIVLVRPAHSSPLSTISHDIQPIFAPQSLDRLVIHPPASTPEASRSHPVARPWPTTADLSEMLTEAFLIITWRLRIVAHSVVAPPRRRPGDC